MTVEIKTDINMEKMFANVAHDVKFKAIPKAIKEASTVVVETAKRIVPQSRETGTGELQSKKQQAKSPKPLQKTITYVIRKYGEVTVGVVGPQYPAGAHGHLVEYGHKKWLWGRRQTGARVEGKEFLAPAADMTRGQQERAILDSLRDSILRAGG